MKLYVETCGLDDCLKLAGSGKKKLTPLVAIDSVIVPDRQGQIHLLQGDYQDESSWLPSSMSGSRNSLLFEGSH